MAKAFCEMLNLPFKSKDMIRTMEQLITGWEFIALVSSDAHENGNLNGMLCASLMPWLGDSSVRFATEICWWIDEDARKKGIGKELVKAYIELAQSAGASKVTMMAFEEFGAEELGKFYESLGFRLNERQYIMEL